MTAADDRPEDARPEDAPPDDARAEHSRELPFDEELAWQQIIANYGERAQLGGAAGPAAAAGAPDGTVPPREGPARLDDARQDEAGPQAPGSTDAGRPVPGSAFDTSYLDATDARSSHELVGAGAADPADGPRRRASDEEHFVPPDPPPVPRGTPARRLAWAGLLLPPVIMVLAVALRWVLPSWAATGLVAAFVGGFVYLVATMPRDGGDGWGDGAVV